MSNFSLATNEASDGIFVLKVSGYLDAHTFEEFDNAINDLYDADHYKIIVDMEGVDYISSAGCGVFIGALGTAMENGGNIVPAAPSENVREVFDLLGLGQVLTIVDTVEAATKVINAG